MTYHCPLCGLYFRYSSELLAHAREDHVHKEEIKVQEEHITRYPTHGRPTPGPVYVRL